MLTELGRSQVEGQQTLCVQTLAVEVQQCPLRAEVGEGLGEELARRKWTWKWMQRWWRRRRRRRRRRTTLIKSNNPHLAGGEKWVLIRHHIFWEIGQKNGTKKVKEKTLAKERVKGMYEHFSPQAAAGHNSGPPQQTYYRGSGLLMDYPLEKLCGCFLGWF